MGREGRESVCIALHCVGHFGSHWSGGRPSLFLKPTNVLLNELLLYTAQNWRKYRLLFTQSFPRLDRVNNAHVLACCILLGVASFLPSPDLEVELNLSDKYHVKML